MTEIEVSDAAQEAWKKGLAWARGCGGADQSRRATGWPGRSAFASLGGCAWRHGHVSGTRSVLKAGGVLA